MKQSSFGKIAIKGTTQPDKKNRSQRRVEEKQSKRNMDVQIVNGVPVFHRKKFNAPQYASHAEWWRAMNMTKREKH